jgi:hypothetical protein
MIDTLNDALARMARTQPLPTFPSSVCDDLLASASLDADDWQHPAPPKAMGANPALHPSHFGKIVIRVD